MGNLLFAGIITLLIIVLPFAIGFYFKKKELFIRYILWSISAIFLVGSIIDHFSKNPMEHDDEKQVIGVYKLDVDSSKVENINLKNYSTLSLVVKGNNTFTISKSVPFIKDTSGLWACHDDGDVPFLEYVFNGNGEKFKLVPLANRWILYHDALKGGNETDQVVFKK